MKRRDFVKIAACTAGGLAAPEVASDESKAAPRASVPVCINPRASTGIVTASEGEQRERLKTIAECSRSVRTCLRKHTIVDYIPAHAMYNLWEYPNGTVWRPNAEDERNLDELAGKGIELIQVHEEWNDSQRLFGADKFTAVNENGFQQFVDMVHSRKMKIMAYISTGYFERRDPDFQEGWARKPDLVELYFQYAGCSPQSPGWRAYMLPRAIAVMDRYRLDGLYDDLGQRPLHNRRIEQAGDDVLAFEETPTYDAALEDLLGILYQEIKRRGGIFKVHSGGASAPPVGTTRVYDYLWVGEAVGDADGMRERVKNHEPYVISCLDMSRAKIDKEDDLYLHSIPYLQFPILLAGRPLTGERALAPGIKYQAEEKCFWTRHCRNINRYYKEHPDGPFSYGWWDSCPGRPEARPTYFKWLELYKPLVKSGTRAFLEIGDSDFFTNPLPGQVVASAFANTRLYLVLANYAKTPVTIETRQPFSSCIEQKAPERSWQIPGRSLLILKKA